MYRFYTYCLCTNDIKGMLCIMIDNNLKGREFAFKTRIQHANIAQLKRICNIILFEKHFKGFAFNK